MAKKPLKWLLEADPQEICEALIAVDEEKAARVMISLGQTLGPEAARRLDAAMEKAEMDPSSALLRAGAGALRSFLG